MWCVYHVFFWEVLYKAVQDKEMVQGVPKGMSVLTTIFLGRPVNLVPRALFKKCSKEAVVTNERG